MTTGNESHLNVNSEAAAPDARLYETVTRDDHLEVVRLVTAGSNPNATDPCFGVPVAYWAADLGHVRTLRILLSLGADRECVGFDGERPLHAAARRGDLACAAVLLMCRADTRSVNQKLEQPLHISSACGNVPVSYLLLACGAERDAADRRGRTPAARAEEGGYALLEFLFTWFEARAAGREGLSAIYSSLAFRKLCSWLVSFGLSCNPSSDARKLHALTRLPVPVERPQPTTALICHGLPARRGITDAGPPVTLEHWSRVREVARQLRRDAASEETVKPLRY
jgi:hypothetical protein